PAGRAACAHACSWTRAVVGRWTSGSTTSDSRFPTCSSWATAWTTTGCIATCPTSPCSTAADAPHRRFGSGHNGRARMNPVYKNLALWMVIGLIVILLFTVFQGAQQGGQEQPNFSEFLKALDQGRVESVVIRGNLVSYTLKDSAQTQRTYIVDYPDFVKTLK